MKEPGGGLVLPEKTKRRFHRQIVTTVATVAALFIVVWIVGLLRTAQDIADLPANESHIDNTVTDQSTVVDQDVQKPPNDAYTDYQGTDQTPVVAGQELVNLLSNETVGAALLLRGFPLDFEAGEVVYMTVVGSQINRFPTGPDSRAGPLWLSPDGNYVVTSEGAGSSNRGTWSWLIRDATVMVDLNQEVLWSVSHQRRTLSRVGLGMPGFLKDESFPPISSVSLGAWGGGL